ncbi:MAG: Ig domain-containing protein [Eubacterium sp.]|nr:Ig domain-containing protein [Eubacterium sp.]
MSQFKKPFLSFVLAFCLIMSFPIASELVLEPYNIGIIEAQAKTKVKLNKTKLVLIKGQNETLKISGTKKKVSWSSSRKTVATVSKGKVSAKKKGSAIIYAKVGGKTYKCSVTVETPRISTSKSNITIFSSSTISVKGTKQKVTWKSSNKKVATVDSKGKVKAKKLGKATITATVGEKKKKYTCKVNVVDTKKGKAYTKLAKKIEQYGHYDSDGDLCLEDYYTNSYGDEMNICVYVLNNKLFLVEHTLFNDGDYSFAQITLGKYNNTANVIFEYYKSDNKSDEPDEIATSSFNSTKWSYHQIDFDIERSSLSYDKYYLVQNLANASIRVLAEDSNIFLNGFELSLNDLGFYAFEK